MSKDSGEFPRYSVNDKLRISPTEYKNQKEAALSMKILSEHFSHELILSKLVENEIQQTKI